MSSKQDGPVTRVKTEKVMEQPSIWDYYLL
jgi:hypothetical protein